MFGRKGNHKTGAPSVPPAPEDGNGALEEGRQLFAERAGLGLTPAETEVLRRAGLEILALEEPWSELDARIMRFLDTVYGGVAIGRRVWTGHAQTWEQRVGCTPQQLAVLARLTAEADVATQLYENKRAAFVLLHREYDRHIAGLRRSTITVDERTGLPKAIPPAGTPSPRALQKMLRDAEVARREFEAARERAEQARGKLNEFKQIVQEAHFGSLPYMPEPDGSSLTDEELRIARTGG